MKKIAIIGAGNVGPTTAFLVALKELADVVLVDQSPGLAEGKALDIMHASIPLFFRSTVFGTSDYQKINGSKIVIIAAGLARKPGMTREDLFEKNQAIMESICEQVKAHVPESIVIVVTNPLDLMCKVAYNSLKFPKNRVMGLSGMLDTSRLNYYASRKGKGRSGLVIGTHDDNMIIVPGNLRNELNEDDLQAIEEKTKTAGATIVGLSGSSYYGPAACLLRMIEAILNDTKTTIPACVMLDGEYGHSGIFIGIPVTLGRDGIEKKIEISLTPLEAERFSASVLRIRKLYETFDI